MKKLITALFCSVIGGSALAQWTPATAKRGSSSEPSLQLEYKLDINMIRNQLKNAQETGRNAQAVEISLPTLRGKLERFAVYSFPVVVKELADQYQLGSYVGVGIDDPTQYVRFSVAPNDFQSMIIKGGEYQFIEPSTTDKTIYTVHLKTKPTSGKSFVCGTEESLAEKQQIEKLLEKGNSFTNQPTDFSKSSDKKYRTMRLAISATSSYVAYTGGTLASALAQINATMTRVNGVFEKDLALHLNVQNYPNIIYVDAATDPYLTLPGTLNAKVQQILTNNVGNANYDIGHVFNAAGNNGNAGCIGCVCIAPTGAAPLGKGSGFTQSTAPSGDAFDIDFVAHEMGHQLGANHTFSHAIEPYSVNVEPGSGSTIMGYAGITGANTDVQNNSDAYFHNVSIRQVQANLISKTCDVETSINNNPPVIAALPSYTIPKGTAFALTASATDSENDPLTYTWEQVDSGTTSAQTINKTNLGTTTYGASFRSFAPTTSPTRYFPKFSSVLAGALNNSLDTWESTSQVARNSKFAVTVRDNNPDPAQQQTQYAEQNITVGADGPFKIDDASQYLFSNVTSAVTWTVANTASAPYNAPNVKIDYSTDNGSTWNVLLASTANDGSENITMPASLNGQFVVLRISAINNVFYAAKRMMVTTQSTCGNTVTGINITAITSTSAVVNWAPVSGATSYNIQYKKTTDATWTQTTSTTNSVSIPNLVANTPYEVQVASVCGTAGPFSTSVIFTTAQISYCANSAANSSQFEYISNVSILNGGTTLMSNSSGPSNYTNYTSNTALQPVLALNTQYSLSITVANPDYDTALVFIDFNNNGVFENSERVLNYPVAIPTAPITRNFTVPATAVTNQPLRMRVILYYAGASNAGLSLGTTYDGCGVYSYGETEDYNIVVVTNLATNEAGNTRNTMIQLYPNPATDVLNITNVSNNARFEIHNAVGQLVKTGTVKNNQVKVDELLKGTYIITVNDKDVKESIKFIKK